MFPSHFFIIFGNKCYKKIQIYFYGFIRLATFTANLKTQFMLNLYIHGQ